MAGTIGTEVYFVAACVVDRDYVYLVEQLEDVDPSEYTHNRMGVFMGSQEIGKQWYYHDVNANIVSACVKKATPDLPRRLIALSKEGEVEIFSNKDGSSVWEKIPDAGLRLGDLGYMTKIREIGDSLFACGYNNQIYQRIGADNWVSLTRGNLQHHHAASDDYGILHAVDGFAEDDLYIVGWKGRAFHWNGSDWTAIETGTDEDLQCVRCYENDEVWIGGNNGMLLKGNIKTGFKNVSAYDDNQTIWSLAKFQGHIYLGTTEGLYVYDGQQIKLVKSGLNPEIDTYTVDSVEGALWSVGAKDVTVFDGKTWTRVDHPDNPPIVP